MHLTPHIRQPKNGLKITVLDTDPKPDIACNYMLTIIVTLALLHSHSHLQAGQESSGRWMTFVFIVLALILHRRVVDWLNIGSIKGCVAYGLRAGILLRVNVHAYT